MSDLAGISAEESAPGFEHIVIAPHFPEGLDHVSASYDSVRGRIVSSWKRTGDKISVEVDIPVGCTAEFRFGDGSVVRELSAGHNSLDI